MDSAFVPYVILIIFTAALFRLPFLNLPMDEDFAFHTYGARFANEGIKWKKDIFIFIPQWKMLFHEWIYGKDPRYGVLRIRLFFMAAHSLTSALIAYGIILLTQNTLAAVTGGMLYAFFGTVPALYTHSFNNEQLYIPVLLAAFYFMMNGDLIVAGLFIGATGVLKYPCLIYIPASAMAVAWYFGMGGAALIIVFAVLPILASYFINHALGYMDTESLRGLSTRFALGLQLPALKKKYGSIRADFVKVVSRTFPLWIAGIPAIGISLYGENGVWFGIFSLATLILFLTQKFFSRYIYLPIIALLALATGGTLDYLLQMNNLLGAVVYTAILIAAILTALGQANFYLRPTAPETLARYKKFDQFIYVPHLGRVLGRLARMRKETGRIFVWGNYTQLYFYIGLPASDQYIHYAIGPWDSREKTGYYDTVIGGIVKHKPIYIIKTFRDLDMELLQKITGLKYILLKTSLSRFPVYRYESVTDANADPLSLPWEEKAMLMEKLTSMEEHSPGIDKTDMHAGKIRRAIKESFKLCRLNRYDLDGWNFLSSLLDQAGRTNEAASALEKLAKEEPLFQGARLMLAKQKIDQGKLDEAETLIRKKTGIFGKKMENSYLWGLLWQKRGQHHKAIRHFEDIHANAPGKMDILVPYAKSLSALGEYERARQLYAKIWEGTPPGENDALRMRAALDMAGMDGDEKQEIETLRRYFEGDPENETLKYALASKMEKSSQKDEARELFRELAHSGRNESVTGAAWYRLALLSPHDKREEMLKKCLKLNPKHSAAAKMVKRFEAADVRA